MAALNNILKAVEALKVLQESSVPSDPAIRKKEKISYCMIIVEGLCSPTVKLIAKYPQVLSFAIETLLTMCDDNEADVRMVVDECLNKVIRAMADSDIVKIQIELYNEIKRNGAARTLRAALWRFGLLSHMIRPTRGKAYVSNLIPCITVIACRPEESVINTLVQTLPLILKTLGPFMTDNDVKTLLKAFFQNISSTQAAFRRAAANMILTTCLHCRKPQIFLCYVLNYLLDTIVPITDEEDHIDTVIGVFGCLKIILSYMYDPAEYEIDDAQQLHSLLQIYELCLHYTKWHSNHNLINAALETLAQLLQTPSAAFKSAILSKEGITFNRILLKQQAVKTSVGGEMSTSTATTISRGNSDSALNLFEPDMPELNPKVEEWIIDSEASFSVISKSKVSNESSNDIIDMKGKALENYSGLKIGIFEGEGLEEGSDVGSEISEKIAFVSLQSNQQKEEDYSEEASISIASPQKFVSDLSLRDIDIGTYTDQDMSIKFCCRYLVSSFLLSGSAGHLMPDKLFRVSVKCLALTCVSNILKLYPDLFFMTVAKDSMNSENQQMIADILLFANHSDPQIRGNVSLIIGSFLKTIFIQYGGYFTNSENDDAKTKTHKDKLLKEMIQLLIQGLKDDSALTCRQTLLALNLCLPGILNSVHNKYGVTILSELPQLLKNPYFLVKVKLAELLSNLSYTTIEHITKKSLFQQHFIDVIIKLLCDQDKRVRHAASEAIVRCIPLLYFQHPQENAVTKTAVQCTEVYLSTVMSTARELASYHEKHKLYINTFVKPFASIIAHNEKRYHPSIEDSLSRIVSILTEMLMVNSSKYVIYGCCEALSLLSESYTTTVYLKGWDCILPKTLVKKFHKRTASRTDINEISLTNEMSLSPVGSVLLSLLLPLLSSSPISLDLSIHRHIILLAGNLASALALCNLKSNEPANKSDTDVSVPWNIFKDKQMCQHMELLLTHIIRILNIFVHVIDDVQLVSLNTKSSLPSLPSTQTLSPKKKVISEQKQREKGEKSINLKFGKDQMGLFTTLPHYVKIYDNLKAAHSNYLVTLDSDASEMYLSLLNAVLDVLSQILEIATINEASRIAEEILFYLQTTVGLSPTATVQCVQQLLKCLFGTNLGAQWTEFDVQKCTDRNNMKDDLKGFYNQCFQNPARQMAETIKSIGNNCRGENVTDTGWVGLLHRRKFSMIFKSLIHPSDRRASVASFIRLFEPMVIKSLEQYTVTSNISLQCQVLMLLSQLVQLRVNYCLLDSDKIFIGFVLKQFEFIEEGQIQKTEKLLPKIFNFLVHLSYEKNHSKVIIGIPKVLQLCDGLMASGQPALTYCIPALAPVVEDIFLVRNANSSTTEQRELETTKEVLISMLLRLVEYHEVIELLALCLAESRFSGDGNGEEKWRRWSRMAIDAVLPMLAAGKIRLESEKAHIALVKLFAAISPTVFRPVDSLLKVLFVAPASLNEPLLQLKRWLGMINIILLSLISCAKEEAMLARLSDLSAHMTDLSHVLLLSESSHQVTDPLNALNFQFTKESPERIFARFIFKVISLISSKIFDLLGLINHKAQDPFLGFSQYTTVDEYLLHQFAFFLQLCIHMFESGSHCKVANATMHMIQKRDILDEEKLPIADLNYLMLNIGNICPVLTCQWAYLMTLLSYNEMSFWSKVLGTSNSDYIVHSPPSEENETNYKNNSINVEVIQKSGIILFCDYVCENLNDAEPLTWLLINHIKEAMHIAIESPVRELLVTAVHRNPAASGLLIQAISTKCTDLSQPSFIKCLLQCIEGAHNSQSGAVIMTLVPKFLSIKYLALSRMAAKIVSRRVEILLTLNPADVIEQLPKHDLVKIMDILQSTKLAKKHGGLVNLLNKLGVQFYDLSPLELDLCRTFNPSTVKSIQLDRDWFLSQVKLRSCHPNATYSTLESAQLISALDFECCLNIFSSKEFNIAILKDCILLGVRLTIEKCQKLELRKTKNEEISGFEESPLYTAAKQCLLEHVHNVIELMPKPHQVFNPWVHHTTNNKELRYTAKFLELLDDLVYWNILFKILPVVKTFTRTLSKLTKYNLAQLDAKAEEDLAKFAVLCFELAHWIIYVDANNTRTLRPCELHRALSCVAEILKHYEPCRIFGDSSHYSWVCSSATALTKVVERLLSTVDSLPCIATAALKPAFEDEDTKDYAQACAQMAILVAWLERCQVENIVKDIPRYLFNTLRDLIVIIGRQSLINSYILIPSLVWKQGWHMVGSGPTKCHFPLLSTESNLLHEVDILEQYIYRINLLGWTSRLQFEEMWMSLLGLLNFSQTGNTPLEEVNTLIQTSSLAVQAITRLLLQTLLLPYPGNPSASHLIHHPRDPQLSLHKISSQKLYTIQDLLLWKYECMNDIHNIGGLRLNHIFHRGNVEGGAIDKFTYSQLSVSYLWSSCNLYEDKLSASVLDLKNCRHNALIAASLDLDSCLRFLVELYTSWLSPQANTPIQLLTETTKSILAISDLFVERAQYQWMLEVCLEISRVHTTENGILYQYLVVCVCKAAAVLTPLDFDTLEKVKRLIDINLKSGFLAARISALHGALYLLQSAVLVKCEETMNIVRPLAIEYIQKHIENQETNGVLSQSEEHQGMMWALVFFLLEHADDTPHDTEAPAVLELVLSLVMSQNISSSLHQTLLQGLERLIATKSVVGKVAEQIVKVAIERLKQPSPILALPAIQLLLTCMYTEAADRLNQPDVEEPLPDVEPEVLVRSIERTSAIFDRIKRGHPMEVEVLCAVLSGILGDFFPPSEILTKVIGEFLSPQQPHPRLLSAVVFKVCERACTSTQMSLLQDWVVFSLPNFIQSLPIAMSTWCLSCFFISASTNSWLRALFPHVQSRIGKYEYEDKKILCIAANDFYHSLPKEAQKKTFVETFEVAAKEPGTPFSDILASF